MSRKHSRHGTRRSKLKKPYSWNSVLNSVRTILVALVTVLFNFLVEKPVEIVDYVRGRVAMMVGKRSGGEEDGLSEKKRARLVNKESKLRAEYSLVVGKEGDGGGRLGEEEFKVMKKELAERKRLLMQLPRFILNSTTGASASVFSTEYSSRTPLLLSDIEHLVTYGYGGVLLVPPPSRWCKMEKPNRLAGVVVLVVDGVGLTEFVDMEAEFGRCMGIFGGDETNRAIVEFLSPNWYGSSVEKEVSEWGIVTGSGGVPITQPLPDNPTQDTPPHFLNVLNQLSSVFPINTAKYKEKSLPTSDTFPRTDLILTLPQMIQERYPLPIPANTIDRDSMRYQPTAESYKPVNSKSKMFSVDCEMCATREDPQALCKIGIVDEGLGVVYESLVKPEGEVVDYLTRWSGVTGGMMEGVNVRLGDVQGVLKGLVGEYPDCVLVGQSLGCDLRAVRMTHPYVIDTSVVFNLNGVEGKKTSLRDLALNLLDEEIQVERRDGGKAGKGHCPVEDATAAMKLVKKKLAEGITFGNAVKNVKYLRQSTRVAVDSGLSGVRQGKLDKNVLLVYKNTVDECEEYTEDNQPSTPPKETPSQEQSKDDITNTPSSNRKVTRINSLTNGNTIKHLSNSLFEYFLSVGIYKIDNEDPDSFRKSIVKLDKRVSKLYNRVGDNSLVIVVCSKDCGGEGRGCGVNSDVVRRNNGVAFVRVKGGGRRE